MSPTSLQAGILLSVLYCVCAYRPMMFRDGPARNYYNPIKFKEVECAEEGSRCFQTSECCTGSVCVTDNGLAGPHSYERGYCMELGSRLLEGGYKKNGETCEDSSECGPGTCCQDIKIFRRGTFRRCAPYYGISKCVQSKTENGVFYRRR